MVLFGIVNFVVVVLIDKVLVRIMCWVMIFVGVLVINYGLMDGFVLFKK